MQFFHFLSYHNAVPIALGILFLGATGVFAATNPEAIYSTKETVISVDNSYIASKDLSGFSPTAQIIEVAEDNDFYYIKYNFGTIALDDYVWRDIVKSESMKVSKVALGSYRDLGLYVMEQLQQKIEREVAYLREVQKIEKNSVSYKQIATAYSGLIGAMFNDTSEILPGYIPVVTPPPPPPPTLSPPPPPSEPTSIVNNNSSNNSTSDSQQPITVINNPGAPTIQILGNNPARIPLKSTYVDLGAIVSDDKDINLGIKLFYNGEEVKSIQIDTSTTSENQVIYRVTDTDGNVGESLRTVIVFDPYAATATTSLMPSVNLDASSTSQKVIEQTSSETSVSTSDNTTDSVSSEQKSPESEVKDGGEIATTEEVEVGTTTTANE
jgi:hypothetical protein